MSPLIWQNLHTALLLLKKICCFSAPWMPAKPNEWAMSLWKQLFIRNITCIFEHVKKQQGFNYLIQTFLSKTFFFLVFFHGYSQQIFLFPYCWVDANISKPMYWGHLFRAVFSSWHQEGLQPSATTSAPHSASGMCQPPVEPCAALDECLFWCYKQPCPHLTWSSGANRENSRGIHFGNQIHKKTAISV